MINIFEISCGLGFAPYLLESLDSHFDRGVQVSRVVRQAGSGLIIRSEDGLALRYRNRAWVLNAAEARHYRATIGFRAEFYDTRLLESEVVVATVEDHLLLSHPQSEVWLDRATVEHIIRATEPVDTGRLPEWLTVSTAGGSLLISDQRSGRWVLLGSDHLEELRRRAAIHSSPPARRPVAPVFDLKGVVVRLHSIFSLARALEALETGVEVDSFEEQTPAARLTVRRNASGVEIADGDGRVSLDRREARKWAAIVRDWLQTLNASERQRGRVRTVFADAEGGRWAAQSGDEVLVESGILASAIAGPSTTGVTDAAIAQYGEFVVVLDPASGNCVALDESEIELATRV